MALLEKHGRDQIKEDLFQTLQEQSETCSEGTIPGYVGLQPLYYGLCERVSQMYGETVGGWNDLPEHTVKELLYELIDEKRAEMAKVRIETDFSEHEVYRSAPMAIFPQA